MDRVRAASSSRPNLEADPQAIRSRRIRTCRRGRSGSVSRAYRRPATRHALRRPSTIRARSRTSAPISLDDGAVEQTRRHQGPALYTVTSLAWDPAGRTLFYTDRQQRVSRPVCSTRRPASSELLMKDARIGDLAFNRADRSLWGIRHSQRHLHARADPAAVQRVEAGLARGPTATSSTTSTSRPTARWSRPRSARSAASRPCA